jgi:PHD/YefM family antitoxin component YafN of YafNO toxin-antitoxin module
MISHKERYVVDEQGQSVGVILGVEEYEKIVEELEELASIRAFDSAKASNDETIPFEQAIIEIEQERQCF